jgi:hypothetical protein
MQLMHQTRPPNTVRDESIVHVIAEMKMQAELAMR